INGGKIQLVEEAGLPFGTSITIRDLFYNIPARRKFLKAESTELSHIASVVTNYALAHPDMHFELHSATNAMLIAPPVTDHSQRIYQVFGKETLDQLIPVAAHIDLQRVGLPQPPPWRREEDYLAPEPGEIRLHGFVSKPEIQKLNKNSIFIFVNGRLIRDRLVQHALTEAYRNIMPPTSYPVVLLFLEMPTTEVDVNVHPSKVEVRFRQQSVVHDFVRDSIRAALMKARAIPAFVQEIHASPKASSSLSPIALATEVAVEEENAFSLKAPQPLAFNQRLGFDVEQAIQIDANAAVPVPRFPPVSFGSHIVAGADTCSPAIEEEPAVPLNGEAPDSRPLLATLKPLGQIR